MFIQKRFHLLCVFFVFITMNINGGTFGEIKNFDKQIISGTIRTLFLSSIVNSELIEYNTNVYPLEIPIREKHKSKYNFPPYLWIIIFIPFLIAVFLLMLYLVQTTRLKVLNQQLEQVVEERTKETQDANKALRLQTEEINTQKEELASQRDIVIHQKEQIAKQLDELEQHRGNLEELVHRRTADLEEAKLKAEESDKLKSAFLANMSHEIRTPLNAIVGSTDLLASTKISIEDREELGKLIESSSENLTQLIDDIIDISKIEAGQMKLKASEFDMDDLMNELHIHYITEKVKLGKEQIQILLKKTKSKGQVVIQADRLRLKQVFSNLLSNGLKYTENGYVEFGYTFVNRDEGSMFLFYVKDTGIGIPRDKFDVIFDRFRKLDNQTGKLYSGTGLGLAISKSIIEMMKGKIWVESVLGKGSVFYFTIPCSIIEGKETAKIDVERIGKIFNWEQYNFLVVEDEISNYEIIKHLLKPTNVKLTWASDGLEAINICKQRKDIDMVLLDIKLPKVDGYEVARQIKEMHPAMKIIAQTAYAMADERVKIFEAGCDDYLAKPLKGPKLLAMIDKYLLEIESY